MNSAASTLDLRLLATDFDGTLYQYGRSSECCPEFAALLARLRAGGAAWVVCSGRPLSSLGKATRQLTHAGVSPDMIVARHGWTYEQRGGLWRLQVGLTLRIQWLTRRRARELERMLRNLSAQLVADYPSCQVTVISPRHYRLRLTSPQEADGAILAAAAWCTDPCVRFAVWQREIEIRAVPCAKAVAVRQVARRRGVTAAETLAIGDGRSDLGMLAPTVAAMTGCPLNASREVVQTVLDAGGHVAGAESMKGTLEIVRAWLNGQVRSVPPPAWLPPRGSLGLGAHAADEDERIRMSRILEASLVAASLAAALVTLDMASGMGFLSCLIRSARAALRAVWSVL